MPSESLTREQVREYDRKAIESGTPGSVLMENAARGAVGVLADLGVKGPVAVVCGKGNNAGDGFVMARLLAEGGILVRVEMVGEAGELKGDAADAFGKLAGTSVEVSRVDENLESRLRRCEWVVDALLGTGTQGEVRSPFDQIIETINGAGRPVLAVDLPSGLDCDTGEPLGPTIRAAHTATFVARKRGFDSPASEQYTGEVHVIDILPSEGR